MHLPLVLILGFVVVGFVIAALAYYLALVFVGLKTTRQRLFKILLIETLFTVAISLVVLKWHIPVGLNFLLWLFDIVVWVALIKIFIPERYKLSTAVVSYFLSYVLISVFSIFMAIVLVGSIMQSYHINGDSMAPAYKNNDTVLVYKFNKHPALNDVVVYKAANKQQEIGRVKGLPGQSYNVTTSLQAIAAEGSAHRLGTNQYYVTVDNPPYYVSPQVINSGSIVGVIGPKL